MTANQEIIAELRRVLGERDEWRDKYYALDQTAGELCDACGWAFKIPGEPCRCEVVRERDEARADAERYLADLRRCAAAPYEHAKERAEAFCRGAEAMREACQQWCRAWENDGEAIADALADLSVPEEP